MKRMHLHINVADIDQAVDFYSVLFGTRPSVVKPDYAKWMLDDPRVNLAISSRARTPGVDHVGIQVDSAAELGELAGRLKDAGAQTMDQEATICCYAKSDKSWVTDTAGVRWETFFTMGEATSYGEDIEVAETAGAYCPGAAATKSACG